MGRSRRIAIFALLGVGMVGVLLLAATGESEFLAFPFFAAGSAMAALGLAARRRALRVHAYVGLGLVLLLLGAGAFGALLLPVLCLVWVAVAGLIAVLGRSPQPSSRR